MAVIIYLVVGILVLGLIGAAFQHLWKPIAGIVISIALIGLIRQYNEDQIRSKIRVEVGINTERCSAQHPILVSLLNGSDKIVVKSQFKLAGFESGFSEARAATEPVVSDKIIKPLGGYELCVSLPSGLSASKAQTYEWYMTNVKFWYD